MTNGKVNETEATVETLRRHLCAIDRVGSDMLTMLSALTMAARDAEDVDALRGAVTCAADSIAQRVAAMESHAGDALFLLAKAERVVEPAGV